MNSTRYDFVISRNAKTDDFQCWKFDPEDPNLLIQSSANLGLSIDKSHTIAPLGNYLIEWGTVQEREVTKKNSKGKESTETESYFPYRLLSFKTDSNNLPTLFEVSKGEWNKKKFWHGRKDFGSAEEDKKNFSGGSELFLFPLHNYMLNFIPTAGRGTFQLWDFDPQKSDPLPEAATPQGAFECIQLGHQLLPIGNFVLDWLPETGEFAVFSFDPQRKMPLERPTIQEGTWKDIDQSHQLVVVGEQVLDWVPATREYRLWDFDIKKENPLSGPVQSGTLPESFDANTALTGVQPNIPVQKDREDQPGTIDFMRKRIKHVVYLMIENRSLDHVCGWLYENDAPAQFVGTDATYEGVNYDHFNLDGDKKVNISKYNNGKLSEDEPLEMLDTDPYHDNSDVMRQLFHGKEPGYEQRATPNMGGFVWNNGSHQVMETFSPEQLPVLNGLAKKYGISDQWFCSMPGGTDVNRAFSLTGSSFSMLNNFQNGAEYANWPNNPHRPSIWRTLWSNGFTDWTVYNAVKWMDFVFTYHLFLDGQIPTVDESVAEDVKAEKQNQAAAAATGEEKTSCVSDKSKHHYVSGFDQFKEDARNSNLPKFSYLEPIWIAKEGTSSYHPGGDLVPGEKMVNEIFESLKAGAWDETLLIVTFDEHGGIFDHVPPSYAENPWPNDEADGFKFDIMGVRVPTIVASPWISEKTVFRSGTDTPFDATSFLATLLDWYGIPKARWGLGERTKHAPTFETTLLEEKARTDDPVFEIPYDKDFPKNGEASKSLQLHDLHRVMVPRLIAHMTSHRLTPSQADKESDRILDEAENLDHLECLLDELHKKVSPSTNN